MWRSAVLALLALATPLSGGVREAHYTEPTTRYDHGILGDAIEFGALEILSDTGKRIILRLPETSVFEDVKPGLADFDGDGDQEVYAVESSLTKGARLAIFDETGLITATPYIGRSHRWLAPIGAADFDRDGRMDIAYVDRPHLTKSLRIFSFSDGALHPVAKLAGVTNHRIGDRFISGGVRMCANTYEMIVMSADWSRIRAVSYKNGRLTTRDLGPYTGQTSSQNALNCN